MRTTALESTSVFLFMVTLVLFPTSALFAGTDTNYTIYFGTAAGPSGSQVTITCKLDFPDGEFDLAGWSIGVCHDVAALDVVSGVAGATTETIFDGDPPDFEQINVFSNDDPDLLPGNSPGANQAVVISLLGTWWLSPGTGYEIFDVTYELLGPDDSIGVVNYCDTTQGGTSPVTTTFAMVGGSSSITPIEIPGTIDIGGIAPPILRVGDHELPGGGAVTAPITLESIENETYGFSFGLSHDGTVCNLLAITPGSDVIDADFFHGDTTPASGSGGTLGCVLSLDSGLSLPAGGVYEIANFSYESAAGASDQDTTALTFTDTLSPGGVAPPTELLVSAGEMGLIPITENGSITIAGDASGTPFVRGDINQDGAVDIADPTSLLIYLFVPEGAVPDCLKTGDVDDNGTLDLADPIYMLNYSFAMGPSIAEPTGTCDLDPTPDTITCDAFACD